MNNSVSGFSLLEFLIYFFFLLFFSLLIFQFSSSLYLRMAEYNGKNTICIGLCAAHDLLIRDIRMASAERDYWKRITESEIIWHDIRKKVDIGWKIKGEKLFRVEGSYDERLEKWLTKTRSLVANKITKVKFQIHGEDTPLVRSITFELESYWPKTQERNNSSDKSLYLIKRDVQVRNGVLV